MSEPLGYLGDGYLEDVWISGVKGLYPRVAFEFRPMLQAELIAYFRAAENLTGEPLRDLVAGLLAAKIKRWDLKANRKGDGVPLTVAAMRNLKDALFNRLFAVVSTREAPDGHASRSDDDAAAAAADLLEAARTDRPVSAIREEREAKNSPAQSPSS